MKPFCSIVIRAFNEQRHIGRLFEGIRQQTEKNVQLILVDSGSRDDTVRIAEQYGAEIVHIQPQEFTFGRSLNMGVAQARADLVVIASAHVYPVYPDWLEKLTQPFADGLVALAYGKQRGTTTTHFSEHQIFQHWFPDVSPVIQAHPFCNNANAAIRRSLWQEHPYDETLPALEDLGWARWAQENNWRIAYVPDAEIIHVHQETWGGVFNRYRREGMAFKRIYPQENFSLIEMLRAWFTNVKVDLCSAARRKSLAANFSQILTFRWLQFYGTYRGYRQSGTLTWQLKQAFYYPRQPAMPLPVQETSTRQPIQYSK